jgi:hypothetical protein
LCVILVFGLLAMCTQAALAKGPKKKGGGQKAAAAPTEEAPPPPPSTAPSVSSGQITQDLADLKAAETAVHETFETSSDWVAAQAAVKQAQTDYNDACGPVIDALKLTPDYKDAADAQEKADANLKDVRSTGSPDDIGAASMAAMNSRSALKEMENKALTTDPSTVAAKKNLTAAFTALAKLREKEQEAVHADPTWQAAKKALDTARGN